MSIIGVKRIIGIYATLVVLLFSVWSCVEQKREATIHYTAEIQNLTTDKLKREYLEAIFRSDQDVRNAKEEYRITSTIGNDSKEYKEHLSKMKETDAINLNKVETYLAQYGHPSKEELGELAALTPWIVVHHQGEYFSRETNFEHLYQGYLNKDINEGSFSMYLARMYQIKNGERLDMGGPYKEKDKIDLLIEKLGLE